MEVKGTDPSLLKAVENASVVDGKVDASGNLVLTTKGGQQKNAGSVVKPLFVWPVGSIYIGTTSTNPADLFGGGTWERFGRGRVLLGFDENDSAFNQPLSVGGSKTHTLTVDQMPNHGHALNDPGHRHAVSAGVSVTTTNEGPGTGVISRTNDQETSLSGTGITLGNTGGNAPHNIMQPYIVVYMWRRTA